ncbi:MAG: TetR/AcrR family transcriptional regulator [Candidatus Cloacimonadaceae bacterium]
MAIKGIKERILDAAVKEFLARGFGGARMQSIADKAEINKALLHYHYNNKQKLYEEVLQDQIARLIASLFDLIDSEGDIDEWLMALIRKYLREILKSPGFSRFILWELNSGQKFMPALFKQVLQQKGKEGNFVLQIVERRLAAGYKACDPVQFLLNVLSLCIYPVLAQPILVQVLGADVFQNPDFALRREEEIFNFVKYGISGYKEA